MNFVVLTNVLYFVKVKDFTKCRLWGFVWICTSLGFISYSAAFSRGGSLAACLDMKPKHIQALPQNLRKNYVTIHTNQSFYLPGEKVPVTLRSTRDFMGFFLQARRVSNDQVAGSFVFIPPGSKLLRCFEDGDTVTHSDKSLKRNLSFVWKSPDQPVGDIKFFVSIVQSYFVYWARIESIVISSNVQNWTSAKQELKVSNTEMSSAISSYPKHSITSAGIHKTTLASTARTKPPEILVNSVTEEMKHVFPNVTSIMKTSPQYVTRRISSVHGHVEAELSLQYHGSTAQTVMLHQTVTNIKSQSLNLTSTHSINSRHKVEQTLMKTSKQLSYIASCTVHDLVPQELKLTSPRPTYPPASFAQHTTQLSQTQEIMKEPMKFSFQDLQILPSSHPSTQYKVLKTTKELSANFLYQPESPPLERNTEIGTPSWVTKSIQEFGGPTKEKENKRTGLQLAMTQLGILLGCAVVLGMAFAAGLRCIHAQYCHRRTEVSFSEPDNNVITLRENGEMMHLKKFRENSFVLVQAEYNWITPAISGKPQ
ncbi:reelin domain-containing protein 1 [Bufo gargarizans]|uniref:reelin domain-containing protein 1 n=1 Tax=Bufo gargarizans TaxID=30331 RepID=UPI001CF5EDD3|nr:reelin domain-containing protein 1 [Bufo gargarizans]